MLKQLQYLIIFSFLILFFHNSSQAQVSPYSLSPKWMFGYGAGMNFSGGAPVLLAGNPSTAGVAPALEESTSICDRTGALAVYTDAVRIYNGATNATVRDMNATDALAANSATDGAVLIPDPSAPASKYYLFLANDVTAGLQPAKGINYYKLTKAGAVVTVTSGPTNLASGASVDESLCAGADSTGGYWIVSHELSNNNFWIWHVTAAGVGAVSKQSHTPYVGGTGNGTVKISKCQDVIAWTGNNSLVVYPWNQNTGTFTNTALFSNVLGMGATGSEPTYGLEISPDGSKVYHTVLGNANTTGGTLKQIDLGLGTIFATPLSTSSVNGGSKELGTMQLGPDDKIYVTNASNLSTGNIYVGVINSPNTAGLGSNYVGNGFLLKPSNAATDPSTYRGIANIAWLDPQDPTISIVNNSCGDYTFTPGFLNYFNTTIGYNKAVWSFGDGTAAVTNTGVSASNPVNHVYTAGSTGNKTITLTLTDATCSYKWYTTVVQNVPCILPVELISFDASAQNGGVNLNWKTATEINNNYFDVQRSTDGIHFETITTKVGAGNSSVITNYSFFDSQEKASNKLYYKLVQHDYDGKTAESKVVVVNLDKTSAVPIALAPNPFNESFVLTKLEDVAASVVVYDLVGRIVEQKNSLEGEMVIQLGSSLVKGTYIVEYITAESSYAVRIEKQ